MGMASKYTLYKYIEAPAFRRGLIRPFESRVPLHVHHAAPGRQRPQADDRLPTGRKA
jgi:hypothetical protein